MACRDISIVMRRDEESLVARHLDKRNKTIDEIMYPDEVIYQTGSGEYVHFSTDKPARGTEYLVVRRNNKQKEDDSE